MKNNSKVKQHILISLCFLFFYILTCILSPKMAIGWFNSSLPASPNFLLCATVALGLLKGRKLGGIYGMIFGFLFDATVGDPFQLSPVIFFLCGYFAKSFARPFLRRNPITALFVSGVLFAFRAVVSSFCIVARWRGITFFNILGAVLPEYFYNLLISPVLFVITVLIFALLKIDTEDNAQ